MICVAIFGGLGNQMFQYACGRALAHKTNMPLVLDLSRLETAKVKSHSTIRNFDLDIFHLNAKKATRNEIRKVKPLFSRIINAISFKLLNQGIQTESYFIERELYYNNNINNIKNSCFLSGYWQSEKYFNSVESSIREEFSFPNIFDCKNKLILNKIVFSNSISLHIRRTDFENNLSDNVHGVCPISYYLQAAEVITSKLDNPDFFIFSDDIDWAKVNLKLPYTCYFVSGNGKKSYVDMQLMSSCKHNIIANSSFSWWGAWLNRNPNKIVVAPNTWFKNSKLNNQTKDLIPNTWIRI
jgi:hypothetical protein